ncbi:MAG TPA: sterol desaturase family protein [Cyclobacteriaceae bacterium]|nr:sterol desaturase family protein [Cyclobacteriaceae bacterium]
MNPIVLSIPIFFLLIGIELVVERLSHRKLYRLPDAIANMSCGITSQVSGLFMRLLGIGIYQVLFQKASLIDMKSVLPGWAYWLTLFLLTDLAYYWAHRMSHEINLFWGGHVVHHQSEDYNLSVALRQSSFQVVWTFFFSLPIALIGYQTLDFALVSAFNTLYQFWIHTETIKKMGWFEYIFNTPSHHRVHHGRDPKYIDKNHAGSLIIWDKMFGTFQAEEERPTYGITTPVNSWNAVWANVSHYAVMAREIRTIPKWTDRVRYLFKKPGWLPEYMGGYRPAPAVDKNTYRKYDTPAPVLLNYYVLAQYVFCLGATSALLFEQRYLDMVQKSVAALLISWWVVNCGVLFEQKSWVRAAEYARIVLFSLGTSLAVMYYALPASLHVVAMGYALISVLWLSKLPSYETKLAT